MSSKSDRLYRRLVAKNIHRGEIGGRSWIMPGYHKPLSITPLSREEVIKVTSSTSFAKEWLSNRYGDLRSRLSFLNSPWTNPKDDHQQVVGILDDNIALDLANRSSHKGIVHSYPKALVYIVSGMWVTSLVVIIVFLYPSLDGAISAAHDGVVFSGDSWYPENLENLLSDPSLSGGSGKENTSDKVNNFNTQQLGGSEPLDPKGFDFSEELSQVQLSRLVKIFHEFKHDFNLKIYEAHPELVYEGIETFLEEVVPTLPTKMDGKFVIEIQDTGVSAWASKNILGEEISNDVAREVVVKSIEMDIFEDIDLFERVTHLLFKMEDDPEEHFFSKINSLLYSHMCSKVDNLTWSNYLELLLNYLDKVTDCISDSMSDKYFPKKTLFFF